MKLAFLLKLASMTLLTTVVMLVENSVVMKDLFEPPPWYVAVQRSETSTATGIHTSSGADSAPRLQGRLDLHPTSLTECVSVRFRGRNETLTVDQAVDHIQNLKVRQQRQRTPFNIGLVFVDEPDGFLSLAHDVLHLFHFLEFLVLGFQELHRLEEAMLTQADDSLKNPSTASLTKIHVPWIYAPLLTVAEICGSAGGINCLIADLVLQASATHAETQHWQTGVHGMESNDLVTIKSHAAFRGQHARRSTTLSILGRMQASGKSQHMNQQADAAVFIHRSSCMDDIHKMWNGRIHNFPVEQWHANLENGLGQRAAPSIPPIDQPTKRLVVGYIDRQNAKRSLPPAEHEWLTSYLSKHPLVELHHLHMEDYSPLEQIQLTAACDVLIGAHGNGLSHVFWMKPGRYVVEIFWRFRFQFDYAFGSQIMGHQYLGLFDGQPIDAGRIERADPTLRTMHRQSLAYEQNMTASRERLDTGREAIVTFLESAMDDLHICT